MEKRTPFLYAAARSGNTRFGAMFLWTGCVCQLLWACAFVGGQLQLDKAALAPISVYSGLAIAGVALALPSRRRNQSGPRTTRRNGTPQRGLLVDLEEVSRGLEANADPRVPLGEPCRVLTLGPPALVQSVFGSLLRSSELIVDYAETAGMALEKLHSLAQSELPRVLIMPWMLPVVTSPDFVRSIKSDPALKTISIVVWGTRMPVSLIESLYRAGATSVIPNQMNAATIAALRGFCTSMAVVSETGCPLSAKTTGCATRENTP